MLMNWLQCLFKQKKFTCEAAGIMFTNGTHVLAGYQPRKKKPHISGLGGGKQEGESYMQTAWRETLEELFEFKEIPKDVIDIIQLTIQPKDTFITDNYINVVYTFADLLQLLQLLHCYEVESNVYTILPYTIPDLIFQRQPNKTTEISHLCLLPLVDHNWKSPFIDANFLKDIATLQEPKK